MSFPVFESVLNPSEIISVLPVLSIKTSKPLFVDDYKKNRATGS